MIEGYEAILAAAEPFCEQAASLGDPMMQHTRPLLPAFCERMGGYEPWKLDPLLETKQFAGTLDVRPVTLEAGQPFELELDLHNIGVFPWIAGKGARIEVQGDAERLGLPATWNYAGEPMVFGDRRTLTLKGTAPEKPGETEITFEFVSAFKGRSVFARERVKLAWD